MLAVGMWRNDCPLAACILGRTELCQNVIVIHDVTPSFTKICRSVSEKLNHRMDRQDTLGPLIRFPSREPKFVLLKWIVATWVELSGIKNEFCVVAVFSYLIRKVVFERTKLCLFVLKGCCLREISILLHLYKQRFYLQIVLRNFEAHFLSDVD